MIPGMTIGDVLASKKPVKKQKLWFGDLTCDFCHKPITKTLVDGRTTSGPWATMCWPCFKSNGVGIGAGSGQKYQQKADDGSDAFVKIEG